MNGLPGLRLLPDAPRPGRSHRTHQARSAQQLQQLDQGTRWASAAFHTGYKQHREPQPTDPQEHQDPRPLPRRTSRHEAHLPRDPPSRREMATGIQLDHSTTRPQDPLRRPTPRLTHQPTGSGLTHRSSDTLPHRLIIGEVNLQPVRNLLRAPRSRPPAVLASRLVPALPRCRCRTRHRIPVRSTNLAAEPLLHILAEPVVVGESRGLRAPGHQLSLPLRDRSTVVQPSTASGRVATQLPRDRRRRSPDPPGDLPNPDTLRPQQRDLLPLLETQIPARD